MARYLINEETLSGIANAIRYKTGGTTAIPVPDMAEQIDDLKTYVAPVLEGITITPTGSEVVKVPPTGVDGFGIVTVKGDANLSPENVREGVTIYGVAGTHSDGIDTSDATATAEDILVSATAYVNGEKIRGTHVCDGAATLETGYVTPNGTEFTLTPDDGVDGFDEVVVDGDEFLVPENVKEGVTIYGVLGTLMEPKHQTKEVTPGAQSVTVTPDEGYNGLSQVTVQGDSNLVSKNIRSGVSIFGVSGSATGSGGVTVEYDMFVLDSMFAGDGKIMQLELIFGEMEGPTT